MWDTIWTEGNGAGRARQWMNWYPKRILETKLLFISSISVFLFSPLSRSYLPILSHTFLNTYITQSPNMSKVSWNNDINVVRSFFISWHFICFFISHLTQHSKVAAWIDWNVMEGSADGGEREIEVNLNISHVGVREWRANWHWHLLTRSRGWSFRMSSDTSL